MYTLRIVTSHKNMFYCTEPSKSLLQGSTVAVLQLIEFKQPTTWEAAASQAQCHSTKSTPKPVIIVKSGPISISNTVGTL